MRPDSGLNASLGRDGAGAVQTYGGTRDVACHAIDIRDATPQVFPGHDFSLPAPVAVPPSAADAPTSKVTEVGLLIDGRRRFKVACSGNGSLDTRTGSCAVQLGESLFLQTSLLDSNNVLRPHRDRGPGRIAFIGRAGSVRGNTDPYSSRAGDW